MAGQVRPRRRALAALHALVLPLHGCDPGAHSQSPLPCLATLPLLLFKQLEPTCVIGFRLTAAFAGEGLIFPAGTYTRPVALSGVRGFLKFGIKVMVSTAPLLTPACCCWPQLPALSVHLLFVCMNGLAWLNCSSDPRPALLHPSPSLCPAARRQRPEPAGGAGVS